MLLMQSKTIDIGLKIYLTSLCFITLLIYIGGASNLLITILILLKLCLYLAVLNLCKSRDLFYPTRLFVILSSTLFLRGFYLQIFFDGQTSDFISASSNIMFNAIIDYQILSLVSDIVVLVCLSSTATLKLNIQSDFRVPHLVTLTLFLIISSFSFYVLVDSADGVVNLLNQRFVTRNDRIFTSIGAHHKVFATFGVIGYLVFSFFQPERFFGKFRHWLMFFFFLSIAFISSGNRSSIVMYLIILMYSYVIFRQKVPLRKVVIFSLVVSFVIVAMTVMRTNRGVERIMASEVSSTGVLHRGFTRATETIVERGIERNGSLAALIHIEKNGNIWGASYRSIPYAFIPSILLEEPKPKAAGRLLAWETAGRNDTAWPMAYYIEAYWNFGLLGVILSSVMYGIVLSCVYVLATAGTLDPLFRIMYISSFLFFSPSSDGFYHSLANFFPIVSFFLVGGLLRVLVKSAFHRR